MGRKAVAAFGRVGGAGAHDPNPDEGDQVTTGTDTTQQTDKTQVDNKDKIVLVGGPGQEQPTFAFKHKDKEFKSSEDLQAYLDGLDSQITTLKTRTVEKPREQPIVPQQQPIVKQEDKEDAWAGLDTMIFADPKAAIQKIRNLTKAEVTTELTQQYQAQQNMNAWWDAFYKENPEFDAKRDFVGMVMSKHYNEIGPLPMVDAKNKLAELTRDEFLQLTGGKIERQNRRTSTTVEGGSNSNSEQQTQRRQQEQTEKPGEVRSLSDAIKARAAARRATRQAS